MKGIVFYGENFARIKEDEDVLKENITRILLTSRGERINNPLFGSNLKTFLFSLETVMREEVESDIVTSIRRWEPRITIDEVTTQLMDDYETFLIKLECTNNDTLEPFTYEQLLTL